MSLALRSRLLPDPGRRRRASTTSSASSTSRTSSVASTSTARRSRPSTVDDVMRPATFVPDSKPVDELLREMQAQRTHVGGRRRRVRRHRRPGDDRGHPRGDRRRDHRRVRHRRTGDRGAAGRRRPGERPAARRRPRRAVRPHRRRRGDRGRRHRRRPAGQRCWARCRSPARQAKFHGLLLRAESLAGRRNRISTVLIHRLDQTATADGRAGAADAAGPVPAGDASREAADG